MIKSVALITVFGAFERFLGFIYRVYLSRALGAEGLAVYQIALSVVGVLVTLSASGIPITVSRLMLKERAGKNPVGESDVISAGILTSLLISIPAVMLLYVFGEKISVFFADERCFPVLAIMLPGVIITGVYAVIRGYFWGNRFYFTYALIELIEEAAMVAVGIILIGKATDIFDGAKKAGVAVFVSYVVSFCLSSLVFVIKSGRLTNPIRKLRPLIVSSSPITAMRTLTSLIGSVVAVILPKSLIRSGLSRSAALAAYGQMSGMALPLLMLPATFIGSVALVISPEISDSFYGGNKEKLVAGAKKAFDFSVVIAALVIPVFIGCGKGIGELVYSDEVAGEYLSLSAALMLPMSVSMITNSLLNSVNKERFTLFCFLFSSALMLLCVAILPRFMGIYALIAGYGVSYSVTGIINLTAFSRFCDKKFRFKRTLAFAALSIAPSAVFSYLVYSLCQKAASLPSSVAVGAAAGMGFCFALLCVFNVIDIKSVLSFVSGALSRKNILKKAAGRSL